MLLIINPGSSSIKYKLFDSQLNEIKKGNFKINHSKPALDFEKITKELSGYAEKIKFVGYRVVHGGPEAEDLAEANIQTIKIIEKYSQYAPLHNPISILIIKKFIETFAFAKHFVAFDNSFFKNLPEIARIYPLPKSIYEKFNIYRYGFHGLSHRSIADEYDSAKNKKLISVHLGSGCSLAAIFNGKPIDTSMGFTPLEGLPMQTRSGDLDPGIVLLLVEKYGANETKNILQNKSGLAGISGLTGDMIEILESNNKLSNLAVDIYCYKISKYIGSYIAALNGIDLLVFSGEIGFRSHEIRNKITKRLSFVSFSTYKFCANEEKTIAKMIMAK